jgi:hypothetical protein
MWFASTGVYVPGTMFPKHVRGLWANGSTETEDTADLWLFGDLAYRDRLTKTLRIRTIPVRPIDYDMPWWHRFE